MPPPGPPFDPTPFLEMLGNLKNGLDVKIVKGLELVSDKMKPELTVQSCQYLVSSIRQLMEKTWQSRPTGEIQDLVTKNFEELKNAILAISQKKEQPVVNVMNQVEVSLLNDSLKSGFTYLYEILKLGHQKKSQEI